MSDIYLDNSATTAPCKEAIEAANTAMMQIYANPSSLHNAGKAAAELMLTARNSVLCALWGDSIAAKLPKKAGMRGGEQYGNLIFTASGTESDNLALFGTVASCKIKTPEIIISDSEHPAVLRAAEKLTESGCKVHYLSTRGGAIDINELKTLLSANTAVVSIMYVNNETGAVYDIPDIFKTVKQISPNAVCHTDCVQAFKKLPFTPQTLNADMISLSAHKIHGIKGVGALWVSAALTAKNRPSPIIFGGGQEGGYRSGTENIPGIAAFGAAAKAGVSSAEFKKSAMQKYELLMSMLPENVRVNAPHGEFTPHIISMTLPIQKSQPMLNWLSSKGIYISSGSACSSHKNTVSHVLTAFGLSEKDADATIRVSMSNDTTENDIIAFAAELRSALEKMAR